MMPTRCDKRAEEKLPVYAIMIALQAGVGKVLICNENAVVHEVFKVPTGERQGFLHDDDVERSVLQNHYILLPSTSF